MLRAWEKFFLNVLYRISRSHGCFGSQKSYIICEHLISSLQPWRINMIKKISHVVMALFIGVLACSIEGKFRCETPGATPFGGGTIQPLSSTPGYDPYRAESKTASRYRRTDPGNEKRAGPWFRPDADMGLLVRLRNLIWASKRLKLKL